MLKIFVQWILRKTQSYLSQHHLGVQFDLYFWCFVSVSAFHWGQMSISEATWTFAPFFLPCFIGRLFVLLTLVRFHAEIFPNFPFSFRFSCDHFCLSFSLALFPIFSQSSGHWPGIVWNFPKDQTSFKNHQCSNNHRWASLAWHQFVCVVLETSMYFSGSGNGMISLLASKVWLLVQRDGGDQELRTSTLVPSTNSRRD